MMRAEVIGPYTAGGWRRARTAHTCDHARGEHGHKGCRGSMTIAPGEEYYDTGEWNGIGSFWATIRICRACAEAARYPAQTAQSRIVST